MLRELAVVVVLVTCGDLATGKVIINIKNPIIRQHDNLKADCEEFCEREECVSTAARILDSLDTKTKPCDDFYQFACGGWVDRQILPPHRQRLNTLTSVDRHLAAARNLLSQPSTSSDLSSVRKAKHLYALCTKYATSSERNTSIAGVIRSRFATWPLTGVEWNDDDFNLEDYLLKATHLDVYPLIRLNLGNGEDTKERKIYYIWLTDPDFGLPVKSYTGDKVTFRIYGEKIYEEAKKFGIENSKIVEQDVEDVVEVEKTLIEMFHTKGDSELQVQTLNDFQEQFGQLLNWTHFLLSLVSSPKVGVTDLNTSSEVVYTFPKYLAKMIKYFSQLPARTQANYIIWRVIETFDNILSKNKLQSLLDKVVRGTTALPSPEESCVVYVSKAFKLVLHRLLYTDKLPPDKINRVFNMLERIRTEFDQVVEEHHWVDENTTKLIKEKNAALVSNLVYYEKSMSDTFVETYYSNVTIDGDNFMENVVKEREEAVLRNLRLVRTIEENSITEMPHELVAEVSGIHNQMYYTSIVFEPPAFTNNVPWSINYGGMGMIFGHELIHAYGTESYKYGKGGEDVQWSNETVSTFLERHQCLIEQYNKFFYEEAGQHINGTLTLDENIADNGGIKLAYRAYKNHVSEIGDKELPLLGLEFSQDQLFFLSFAQIWCNVNNKVAANNSIHNEHSPGKFRVIGTAQNSKDFARAFSCPVGSPMNPEHKCEVW